MRVVVVTTSFPRSDDDPAGHFVRTSALRMARLGAEVHVIAPGGSVLDAPRETDGLTVHRAGGGLLFAWPGAIARMHEAPWRALAAPAFAVAVRLRLRQIGAVDRVVAHWIVPSAFPLLADARAPLEVVAHGADVRLLLALPRALRQRIVESLLDRGATFAFAARLLLTSLEEALGPTLARVLAGVARVEPPALDVPDVGDRRAELRAALSPSERLVVAVSRLIPSKRVELAIEAVHALGPSVRLAVIGDGPDKKRLLALATSLGARTHFAGALPRREALAWIAAADVLVHPSSVEAAPTAIREARALGVRVVACDAGDIAAWAESDPSILVVEPRAPAITAALRASLDA